MVTEFYILWKVTAVKVKLITEGKKIQHKFITNVKLLN